MKSVTEFANFTLNQGIKAKAALAAESKTPEEIEQSLGATFKLEGEKLKYFVQALEIAGQNSENLRRVLVVSLAEGEKEPAKATKVDEVYVYPEFNQDPKKASAKADDKRGGGRGGRPGGKGGPGKGGPGKGGPKESPWGLSPEEKAAKAGKITPKKA